LPPRPPAPSIARQRVSVMAISRHALILALLLLPDKAAAVRTASGSSRSTCEAEQFRGVWKKMDAEGGEVAWHTPDVIVLEKNTPLTALTPWFFRAFWKERDSSASPSRGKQVVTGEASLNMEQCCLAASEVRLPYICLQSDGGIILFDAMIPKSIWRVPDVDRVLGKFKKYVPNEGGNASHDDHEEHHDSSVGHVAIDHDHPEEGREEQEAEEEELKEEAVPREAELLRQRRQAHRLTGNWELNRTFGVGSPLPNFVQFAEKHALGLLINWRYRAIWVGEDDSLAASGVAAHAHDAITGDAAWSEAHGCLTTSDPRMRFWCPRRHAVLVYESASNASIAAGPDERRLVGQYTRRAHRNSGTFSLRLATHRAATQTAQPKTTGEPVQAPNITGVWSLQEEFQDIGHAPHKVHFAEASMLNFMSHWKYKTIWNCPQDKLASRLKGSKSAVTGDAVWNVHIGCVLLSDPRIKFWCLQGDGSAIVFATSANVSITTGPSEERRVARYTRPGADATGSIAGGTLSFEGAEKSVKADSFDGVWEQIEVFANSTFRAPASADFSMASPEFYFSLWRYVVTWGVDGDASHGAKEVATGDASFSDATSCLVTRDVRMTFWCLQDDGSLLLYAPKSAMSVWLGPDLDRPIARYGKSSEPPSRAAAEQAKLLTGPQMPSGAVAPMTTEVWLEAGQLEGTWELVESTSASHSPPDAIEFTKASALSFMTIWRYQAIWHAEGDAAASASKAPMEIASGDATADARLRCLTTSDSRMRFWCVEDGGDLVLLEAKTTNSPWAGPDRERRIARYARSAPSEGASSEDLANNEAVGVPKLVVVDSAAQDIAPEAEVSRFVGTWDLVGDVGSADGHRPPDSIRFAKVDHPGFAAWRFSATWNASEIGAAGQEVPGPTEGEATLNEGNHCLVTSDARMRFWSLRTDGSLFLLPAKDARSVWRGPSMDQPLARYAKRA